VNERVSVALQAGASEASMLDITPEGHSLWRDFDARCRSLEISGYKNICVDITGADLKQKVGTFDVVHCSGVIYHVPDLVAFVRNLMSIATRHLIIQSMVVPERIENEFGILDLSGGHCLFVPLLSETQRRIAAKYLKQVALANIPDLTGPPVKRWVHQGLWNFGPWSWLITPDFLRRLMEICGLEVIDEGFVWENKAYSVFCAVPSAALT
jgi:SAM-dependent methyltransferase